MPTYLITAPDGQKYKVTGDGTEEQALAHIQAQYGNRDGKASDPSEYDPQSAAFKAKYGPAGSATENLLAGAGKAFVDLGRGVKQLAIEATEPLRSPSVTDLVTGQSASERYRQEVQAQRELDAPLMDTKAGKIGNVVGNVAATAPALAIPGANTVAGAGLIGAGLGAAQPVAQDNERLVNTAVGGVTGAVAQKIGGKIAEYAQQKLASRAANAASSEVQNAVRDATLREARKAGYVVPPATSNPTATNRVAESIAGKAATQQSAALKNQRVTNNLVREELGLSADAPLTKGTLNTIRSKAGSVYKAITKAGRVAVDDQYLEDLGGIAKSIDDVAKDFPDANVGSSDQIDKLVNSLLRDDFDSSSAVAYIKQLRNDASSNLSFQASADPAKKALGFAQRDAAAALEDMLIRHLQNTGKGGLADAFDKARTLIAKTYSVEAALNEGSGNVVAGQLANQLKRNKPLSGNLALAARFAQAFPKAAAEIKDSPGVSAVDALVGGVGGITLNPALAALPFGRIAAREGLLTNAGQVLAKPNYAPSASGTATLQLLKQAKRAALPAAAYSTQQ